MYIVYIIRIYESCFLQLFIGNFYVTFLYIYGFTNSTDRIFCNAHLLDPTLNTARLGSVIDFVCEVIRIQNHDMWSIHAWYSR